MGLAQKITALTVDEYLALEEASNIRHEFVDGYIHAMAGGTLNHNRISMDFGRLLNDRMTGKNCEAFVENIIVRISAAIYYYPDVVVACDEIDGHESVIHNPVLVVEVLSKSTEKIDRREKMIEYQMVSGLREYAIVTQDKMQIEVYRHDNAGEAWEGEIYTEPEQEVLFASVGVKMLVSEIYQRVKFDVNINE